MCVCVSISHGWTQYSDCIVLAAAEFCVCVCVCVCVSHGWTQYSYCIVLAAAEFPGERGGALPAVAAAHAVRVVRAAEPDRRPRLPRAVEPLQEQRVSECVKECMPECVNEYYVRGVTECVSECLNECVNEHTKKCVTE